jgi:hypothetical protein
VGVTLQVPRRRETRADPTPPDRASGHAFGIRRRHRPRTPGWCPPAPLRLAGARLRAAGALGGQLRRAFSGRRFRPRRACGRASSKYTRPALVAVTTSSSDTVTSPRAISDRATRPSSSSAGTRRSRRITRRRSSCPAFRPGFTGWRPDFGRIWRLPARVATTSGPAISARPTRRSGRSSRPSTSSTRSPP